MNEMLGRKNEDFWHLALGAGMRRGNLEGGKVHPVDFSIHLDCFRMHLSKTQVIRLKCLHFCWSRYTTTKHGTRLNLKCIFNCMHPHAYIYIHIKYTYYICIYTYMDKCRKIKRTRESKWGSKITTRLLVSCCCRQLRNLIKRSEARGENIGCTHEVVGSSVWSGFDCVCLQVLLVLLCRSLSCSWLVRCLLVCFFVWFLGCLVGFFVARLLVAWLLSWLVCPSICVVRWFGQSQSTHLKQREIHVSQNLMYINLCNCIYGGFLKWWYPTTMGFPTKTIIWGFWGYHHCRNPPHI